MASSITLYIICWLLIVLIVVALSLTIIYGRKIDDCRTSKTLYCYAKQDTGWRCDTSSQVGGITLYDQLTTINSTCNPIDCVTLGDPLPSTPGSTQFTVLPFDSIFECGTNVGFSCDPSTDVTSDNILNFPGDPLIPVNNEITGPTLMSWFCNPLFPATTTKISALNAFTKAHPEAYICRNIVFKGQTVT